MTDEECARNIMLKFAGPNPKSGQELSQNEILMAFVGSPWEGGADMDRGYTFAAYHEWIEVLPNKGCRLLEAGVPQVGKYA